MSTSCEGYIGFTVTLKENLTSKDFDKYWDFKDAYGEYNLYDCQGKVSLITDGMNGEFARLIFVDHFISDCWVEGKDYFKLRDVPVPDDVYEKLNEAHMRLNEIPLDKNRIEYALWYLFC